MADRKFTGSAARWTALKTEIKPPQLTLGGPTVPVGEVNTNDENMDMIIDETVGPNSSQDLDGSMTSNMPTLTPGLPTKIVSSNSEKSSNNDVLESTIEKKKNKRKKSIEQLAEVTTKG